MKQTKKLPALFLTFLRIGAFTFGGGYAMIPLIQREITEKRKWLREEDLLDIIAIAESTPGPIAINTATFVGYRVCGFAGALCATLGVVLPSFCILLAVSALLRTFAEVRAIAYAFRGIRAGVLALIVRALWSMYKQCPKNPAAYFLMGASFLCAGVFSFSVLPVLIGCALFGLIWTLVRERREKR